ncbi:hypothetical protein EDC55_1301 [Allofrancisella inopinata]|uniref:hypothetical protein n=1 Tax=Allofrancisella inopinata TaxID=1085647 RepID=UPI0010628B38|nr:hypothetical protein [Allofrancisella inopinata]TDT66935.1 hypothetical protein EDC55_1301 [Allofrancisella inopinata]
MYKFGIDKKNVLKMVKEKNGKELFWTWQVYLGKRDFMKELAPEHWEFESEFEGKKCIVVESRLLKNLDETIKVYIENSRV